VLKLDSYVKKIRVVSDLHLGHPASLIGNISELLPILKGIDVLILNGDTVQERHPEWHERSKQMFAQFESKAKELGVELFRTAGNHDPQTALRQAINVDNERVLITHGDSFFAEGSPWIRDFSKNWQQLLPLMKKIPTYGNDLDKRVELAGEISSSLRAYKPIPDSMKAEWIRLAKEPKRVGRILMAWSVMWDMAQSFIQRYAPNTRVLIFGHFHRNSIQQSHQNVKICTGAFLNKLNASVVDLFDGNVEVRNLFFKKGSFYLEPTPRLVLS